MQGNRGPPGVRGTQGPAVGPREVVTTHEPKSRAQGLQLTVNVIHKIVKL